MARDVDDEAVALLVGIDRVEDVARLDLEPTDSGIRAVTGHHAETCPCVAIEQERQTRLERTEIETDG